jgi:hypothetical protein
MREERVTPGALGVLMYCALLAPMFRVAPGAGAAPAREGGWLSPLPALLVLLLPVWVLIRTCRILPEGEGLSRIYTLAFGKGAGRLVTGVTGVWALVTAAAALRYYSESIVASVYQNTGIWVFLLGVMLVAWRAGTLGMEALCRLAKAYLMIAGTVLALVLLMSVREVQGAYLIPFWTGGWRGMLESALPILGVQAPVMLILFRRTQAAAQSAGGRVLTLWLAASCLTMMAVRGAVIGMFGWQTAVRLQIPLFSTAKEVYLLEVFERIEALVVAVWVLTDIIWIAALLLSASDYVAESLGRKEGGALTAILALAILLLSAWSEGDAFQVRWVLVHVVQYVNLAVCLVLPVAGCALARVRGKI